MNSGTRGGLEKAYMMEVIAETKKEWKEANNATYSCQTIKKPERCSRKTVGNIRSQWSP